jgi:tetratricopeptide (TPR) repeat protein
MSKGKTGQEIHVHVVIKSLFQALVVMWALAVVTGCSPAPDPAIERDKALRRGDELLAKKQIPDAARAYQQAVRADQQSGEARLKLAKALLAMGDWTTAAPVAIRAADLLPVNDEAQLLAISMLVATKRFPDAIDRVTARMKTDPDNPKLLILLGNARAGMANSWMAIERADAVWRSGRPKFYGQGAFRSAENDAAAEAAFARALQLDPKSIEASMALANLAWAKGRLDEGANRLKELADLHPDDILANRAMGSYFMSIGKNAEAEKYFRVAAASGNRESLFALATYHARVGRFTEALGILEPLAASASPDNGAQVAAADVELHMGRPREALARVDKVLGKEANHSAALLLKARALMALGNHPAALSTAERAVSTAPTSKEARVVLGEALVATGNLSRAFDEYSEAWRSDLRDPDLAKTLAEVALALGRDGVAEDLANQSLRLRPGDLQTALVFARAQIRLRNYAAAERALTAAAKGHPNSSPILALQGSIQAWRGDVNGARASFHKALQVDRDSLQALSGLVAVEAKARETRRIRSLVDGAIGRHPDDPGFLMLAAQVASAEGNRQEAEKALRAILAIDAAREDALVQLSDLLARQGRHKEAQSAVERGLERQPSSSVLRLALAGLLEQQGILDAAQSQYDRVIADTQVTAASTDMLRMQHTASARLAAMYANNSQNLDVALQLASAAKRQFPDEPFFSDTLGWIHVRKDRARLGLQDIQAAVKAEPDNPLFRYHLGAAYESLAEFDKARAELNRALQTDPDFHGAAHARALLKSIGR